MEKASRISWKTFLELFSLVYLQEEGDAPHALSLESFLKAEACLQIN